MKNTATAAVSPEVIARRTTADGKGVYLYSDGDIANQLGATFTRHATLPLPLAWEVMEAVALFDVAEMPAVMTAASKAAKRGGAVAYWDLVQAAIVESAKAHTIPADMPPAVVTMTLTDYANPEDFNLPPGYIPAQRPGRRAKVAIR